MQENQETGEPPCNCADIPDSENGDVCAPCHPKDYVSADQESILGKMREIKALMRPIAERLNELERFEGASAGGVSHEGRAEWNELAGRLEELRTEWNDLLAGLDAAIERKLVLLGHRDPS